MAGTGEVYGLFLDGRVSGVERVTGVRARERGVPEIRAAIVIGRGSAAEAAVNVAYALLVVCGRMDADFHVNGSQQARRMVSLFKNRTYRGSWLTRNGKCVHNVVQGEPQQSSRQKFSNA